MLISRGGTTRIMFCHQTGGYITGWGYNRDFTVFGEKGNKNNKEKVMLFIQM